MDTIELVKWDTKLNERHSTVCECDSIEEALELLSTCKDGTEVEHRVLVNGMWLT